MGSDVLTKAELTKTRPHRHMSAPIIKPHLGTFYVLIAAKVSSVISLVVSWGLLTIIVNFITPSLFILIRQINDDDDDPSQSELILVWLLVWVDPGHCLYLPV